MKVKVWKVWISRAEGPIGQCGEHAYEGPDALKQAQRQMYSWGVTAPAPGSGYDKCDFVVEFENGETYAGRYDLQSDGLAGGLTIAGQMRQQLSFIAGDYRPAWCDDDELWEDIRRSHEGSADEAREWLETYELEVA